MPYINDEYLERDSTMLRDGPLDGQRTPRPTAKMRKVQHAQAFRLDDELQPWQPGMPGPERVKFAVYLWLCSEQRYCWVSHVSVGSKAELDQALLVVAEG